MYLINLLPTELNDDILIILGSLDFALQSERFWVAAQLYQEVSRTFRRRLPQSLHEWHARRVWRA